MAGIRRPSASVIVLCIGAVASIAVFGVRADYSPVSYAAIAAVEAGTLAIAMWFAGASRAVTGTGNDRTLAAAGVLLVAPCVLFAFVPGLGPPWLATAEENQRRYLVLLLDTLAISGGLMLLCRALRDAGERFYSALGSASISLAGPAYVTWASTMLAASYARGRSVEVSAAMEGFISDVADALLFVAGLLTYAATAAIAASLPRAGMLGRRTALALVGVSLAAAVFLAARGVRFPDPDVALGTWYLVPGFVAGIPAIPWLAAIAFGFVALRRAREAAARRPGGA